MAGWLIVSLTKYSILDAEPHKRIDRKEFSPCEASFHGIVPKQGSGLEGVSEWERGGPY
jgi:hypothetical protein